MATLSENEIAKLKKVRLRWFVTKLIELSNNPITIMGGYDEYLILPAAKLLKSEPELFPPETCEEQVPAVEGEYCINECSEMLTKIANDMRTKGSKYLGSDIENLQWIPDGRGYNDKYVYHVKINVPLFQAYLRFMDDDETRLMGADSKNKARVPIKKIEVLEDKSEQKRIIIYINGNYDKPREFSRGKNWGKMYKLAMMQELSYDKDFFDYFNYSTLNPLYTDRGGFSITKIVKVEDGSIVPNIEIKSTTQNKITRQLKTA